MENNFDLLNFDVGSLDDSSEEISYEEVKDLNIKNILNLDSIKKDINIFSTKKICNIIISNRYLSFDKELNIFCMEELGRRRAAGDNFLFEDYIEEELNKFPQLNINFNKLLNVLNNNSVRKKWVKK